MSQQMPVSHKILAPLDGSELATTVLPHVVTLAHVLQSSLTLLRVLDCSSAASSAPAGSVNPVDWQLHRLAAQAQLDALQLRLRHCFDQLSLDQLPTDSLPTDSLPTDQLLSVATVEGPAATRILEYAQKHASDLLALASHGQGGLNGWQLGSVAQKVIERARTSILLVRADQALPAPQPQTATTVAGDQQVAEAWCNFRYQRILVLLDGSQRAEHVLPLAAALAQHCAAELHLAHVVVKPVAIERMPLGNEENRLPDQLLDRNRAQATHYLAELQARLAPPTQSHVLINESVASALHQLVADQAIDLVVLSAHGFSCQQQWPSGAIASSFIRYGASTLLILQDLPAHEILDSNAERLAKQAQPTGNGSTRSTSATWEGAKGALVA